MAKKRKTDPVQEGVKVLARNKQAFHHYEIGERLEAGLVLVGSEIKSLRDARATLTEGFVEFTRGEAWLVGIQINEYPFANQFNHQPGRKRKLLLHKAELRKLNIRAVQRGLSVVPLSLYLKNNRVKVELGIGRGRKEYEKRHAKREQEAARDIEQATRRRR